MAAFKSVRGELKKISLNWQAVSISLDRYPFLFSLMFPIFLKNRCPSFFVLFLYQESLKFHLASFLT